MRVVDRNEEATAEPVAVAVRDEGRSELRDPSALRVVIIINLSGV